MSARRSRTPIPARALASRQPNVLVSTEKLKKRRGTRLAVIGAAASLYLVAGTAQATTPESVVDTPAYEFGSASGGGWLAWSRGANYTADHDLYVREAGQPADVVELGRFQHAGNIELGGDHGDILVFDFRPTNGDRDIRFYDLATGTVSAPPNGINTAKDDEFVSISGNHLLFSRGPAGALFSKKVYLYDFTTEDLTLLATAPARGTATANSVSGDFATYTVCPASGRCDVVRHEISTDSDTLMPRGNRANYWSFVLADGTVYFVQGHPTNCGVRTKIMRYAAGSTEELVQFQDGVEIADLDVVQETGGPVVYFTRVRCNGLPGIWKLAG